MSTLTVAAETFPIRGSFTISRGSRTEVQVLVAEIADGDVRGRGECVPYARYGESIASVTGQIESVRAAIEAGARRDGLADLMPAGAARNAVDCALIDLEAKRTGEPAWRLLGLPEPKPTVTAFTISLGTPADMATGAAAAAARPLLKVKLGGTGDIERIAAVRQAAPQARLIVDANEAWSADMVVPYSAAMAAHGVELIEQPLPAGDDAMLADVAHPVPVCADESCHDRAGLAALAGRYDYVNIKLDKSGGLTEAIALADAARALGLQVMVGCMLGTSLGMAPALLLAAGAQFIDLDGPLLLAHDRPDGLDYRGSLVVPPSARLWG